MSGRRSRKDELVQTEPDAAQPTTFETPPSPKGKVGFSVSTSYSGPIPPQQLEAYQRTETGRLYVQAMIKQSNHRMEMEVIVIKGDDKRANLGLWFALIIALEFCGTGGWLVHGGHDWAGGTIATTSVVGLVTAFLKGSSLRNAERIEKAKLVSGPKEDAKQLTGEEEATPRLPGM